MTKNQRLNALLIATIVSRSRQATPFNDVYENDSYAHLAMLCAERGIDLHLTHFENLLSDKHAFAWKLRGSTWQLVECRIPSLSLCYADLPQNFPKAVEFKQALRAHPIKIVNDLRLSDCLMDKLATHDLFSGHVPLTLIANGTDIVARLRGAEQHADLSIHKLFLKPRYGERGRGIYVTDLDGLAAHQAIKQKDYIIQALLETSSGIPELNIRGRHDLRMVICNGDIVLTFARVPAEGSYVSNYCQGGREVRLTLEQLPERLLDFASMVDARLRHYGPRLFSLDIGIGQSGKIWIYELNTMPGIVWDELPGSKATFGTMHRILASWMHSALA